MWWFLNYTGFPFAFLHRYGNLAIQEFSSKRVKVMLSYIEGGGRLPVVYIKIYFFLNTYSIESKMFLNLTYIFLDPQRIFRKLLKKIGFFTKIIFCSAWLSNHAVCKIGLKYFFQHCFICRPSYSNVSEDAGFESRTVWTFALVVRTL
jgi:hypothetical protein